MQVRPEAVCFCFAPAAITHMLLADLFQHSPAEKRINLGLVAGSF
jgi:hypothetical protein